ncbi:MAG: DNA translocase FtsK [Thermoflexales bacterium]|nr:DNA translocase FtsK [Thermoflexales bacterium]
MPSRQVLELQADRIEMVLQAHKSPARVTGGVVTPRAVRFELAPYPTTRVSRLQALAQDLALALGAPDVAVSRHGQAVCLNIPRPDAQPIQLLPLCQRLGKDVPPFTAVLGLADDGLPLLLHLPSPNVAHVLVAGCTGSGKTALAQTLILSLAMSHRRSQLALVLIDPKGRAFKRLAALPQLLWPVLIDPNDAADALDELVRLMESRDRARACLPRIVLVVDELADLIYVGGKSVADTLTRLTQRGREAGVHVLACTQKPSSALLGPLMKANFPVRLVGKVTSAEDARVAAGVGGSDAHKLAGGGDFVAVAGGGIIRFQAAYIRPGEVERVVEVLERGGRQ